jgi:hypothetical protein
MSIDRLEWPQGRVHLGLTGDQVTHVPDVDRAKPISRQWEIAYDSYFSFPYYWTGAAMRTGAETPIEVRRLEATSAPPGSAVPEDRHLRSAQEVAGNHIHPHDGEIGHIEDFLVDDSSWVIGYIMIDTSNWIGGRTVLVAPQWCSRIDWAQREMYKDLMRETVKESLCYEPGAELDPHFDERLGNVFLHRGREA